MKHNIPEGILELIDAIKREDGKAYLVGGGVIDLIQDREIKDWDIEVFFLNYEDLLTIATKVAGKADLIGQKFGVIKTNYKGLDIELSIPRKDSKFGPKHKDFDIELIPNLSIKEAARRRDFTINAIYYDFENGDYLDPFNGLEDLRFGKLHPVDPKTFIEDPLRAFRAIQLVARKAKTWTTHLEDLIGTMIPECWHLTGDAIFGEMNKLLMIAEYPSIGLEFLDNKFGPGLIDLFPELKALITCEQRAKYHPEGTVWTHTLMVVDEAAKWREELPEDWRQAFMWGALLHDIGKPIATHMDEEKGHLTSIEHDKLGEPIARAFMERLTSNEDLINKVCAIVKVHMRPRLLIKATPKRQAWKRLQNICPLNVLAYVSMIDNDGRGIREEERTGKNDVSFEHTMAVHRELGSPKANIKPILMGRHLIKFGYKPGPEFGPILEKAYEYQLDTDETDIEELFDYGIS